MKIIAIASQKGGVGKSTLAIHLAVAAHNDGMDVLLADLDPHSQTATEWASERRSDFPVVVQVDHVDMKALIDQAKDEGFDLVIFDCPPYINDVVYEASTLADYTLIPSQPEFAPIRTLGRIVEVVSDPYAVVLNGCHPARLGNETQKTREARVAVLNAGIRVAPQAISRRIDLTDALNSGDSVFEYDMQGKASVEVQSLYEWVKEELR